MLTGLLGKGELILIVEDDVVVRNMTSSMVSVLGYKVKALASGEEALQYLVEHESHLVILDMQLGAGLNGRETYERILSMWPGQRAIVVSGYAESREIQKTLELGASRFVKKPYSLYDLGLAIKAALVE